MLSELTIMYKFVRLQAVALRKTCMADVALVGLLARVYAKMALEFKGIGAGICAVRTLVGALSCVTSDVALQL